MPRSEDEDEPRADQVMPSSSLRKFRYRRRSPFLHFARLTEDELNDIDRFVELAREARKSQEERLERLAAQIRRDAPDDDWLVDDFAQLHDFAALCAEFAIIGLWRCVETLQKTSYSYRFGRARCREGIPAQEISARAFEIGNPGATDSLCPIRE
jgi:hypothetical protein